MQLRPALPDKVCVPTADTPARAPQLNRVTKVLKGGKLMKFRATVVAGNYGGEVGYGVASAREVVDAVQRASAAARKDAIEVPMAKGRTFPHKLQIKEGAVRIMLRPAAEGTGVIAGGSVRIVLELAGYQNAFGKIYGTSNAMNNVRGTIAALSQMTTWREISAARGVTIDYLHGRTDDPQGIAPRKTKTAAEQRISDEGPVLPENWESSDSEEGELAGASSGEDTVNAM
jgi:ribosomal protein S5